MKTVNKSVLIWYSPAEMFALVTDVPKYPEFLPWCSSASILEQTPHGMTAEVGMSIAGLHQSFVTRNEHVLNESVRVQLVKGPFSQLEGMWRFLPVGDGQQRACRIELDLTYGFSSATLARVVGPVFDRIASSMMEAFVQRAEKVYG